jgi:hypothetical protein
VNAAGDVYSFGMVLLQLLSGKRATNIMNTPNPMSLDKRVRLEDIRVNFTFCNEVID